MVGKKWKHGRRILFFTNSMQFGDSGNMNKVTYGMVEEIYSLGNLSRRAYGIVAYANAEEDGTATVVASAHDLTSDRRRAERLAVECNLGKLALHHFEDVIEDFLAE